MDRVVWKSVYYEAGEDYRLSKTPAVDAETMAVTKRNTEMPTNASVGIACVFKRIVLYQCTRIFLKKSPVFRMTLSTFTFIEGLNMDAMKSKLHAELGACVFSSVPSGEHEHELLALAYASTVRVPILQYCGKAGLIVELQERVRVFVRKWRRDGFASATHLLDGVVAKDDEAEWNQATAVAVQHMALLQCQEHAVDEQHFLDATSVAALPNKTEHAGTSWITKLMRRADRFWMQVAACAVDVAFHGAPPAFCMLTPHHFMCETTADAPQTVLQIVAQFVLRCVVESVHKLGAFRLPLCADTYAKFVTVVQETFSLKCSAAAAMPMYRNPFGVYVSKHVAVSVFASMFNVPPNVVVDALLKLEVADSFISWPVSVSELHLLLESCPVIAHHQSLATLAPIQTSARAAIKRRNGVLRCLQLAFADDRGVRLRAMPSRSIACVIRRCIAQLDCVFRHESRGSKTLRTSTLRKLLEEVCIEVLHILAKLDMVPRQFVRRRVCGPDTQFEAFAKQLASCMLIPDDDDGAQDGDTAARSHCLVFTLRPLLHALDTGVPSHSFVRHKRKTLPCTRRMFSANDPAAPPDFYQRICEPCMPWLSSSNGLCGHSCQPLFDPCMEHDSSDFVRASFAAPTPQMLFNELDGSSRDDIEVAATACTWNLAFFARRTLRSLHHARLPSSTPSLLCFACCEELPNWSLCTEHPMCLHCLLARFEGVAVDLLMYRKADVSDRLLFTCAATGCAALAVHDGALTPWLVPEIVACVRFWQRRQIESKCITCGVCRSLCLPSADGVVFKCDTCHMDTCVQCNMCSHPGRVCAEAFRRECGLTPEDVLSIAKKQACPGCFRAVVKDTGCNHMVCVCGQHWCWACGEKVDVLNPSVHFKDVVGGTPDASCSQFVLDADDDVRLRGKVLAMTDISSELRDQALVLLSQSH